MSAKASVFIATSLDGFIAGQNGEIGWLDDANGTVPEGEDCGYGAFIDSVDVLIMGRKTYEKVLTFDEWPYCDTRVIVMSRSTVSFQDDLPNTVSHSSETPSSLYCRLSEEGANHLYINGGITIQRFLNEGLIDELTITVIPILLGGGTPLFGPMEKDDSLVHIDTKSFEFGFVQTKYKVIRC